MKIGIENFRVFKKYTEFEVKPITLLVGPNNSGKSSFTKLLLLLKNNLLSLNFKAGNHNLENIKNVLSWDREKDKNHFTIRLPCGIQFLGDEFSVKYIYTSESPDGFAIENKKERLLVIHETSEAPKMSINIKSLINWLYEGHMIMFRTSIRPDVIEPKSKYRDCKLEENALESIINLSNFDELTGNLREDKRNNLQPYIFMNELLAIEKDHLLYNLIINGETVTYSHKKEILSLQDKEFGHIELPYGFVEDFNRYEDSLYGQYEYGLDNVFNRVKESLKSFYESKYQGQTVKVESSPLGDLLFNKKIFGNSFSGFRTFINNFKFVTKNLSNIEYIPANRGNQNRILANNSGYAIDEIVATFGDYSNLDFEKDEIIREIFKIMEIPGELEIKRYENTISVLYLNQGDKKVSLADLGFGFSQIIPIILKISNSSGLFNRFNNFLLRNITFIVEEPEANLHPKLQSKLADLFVYLSNRFKDSGMKFIIETHSEYFIRKLQYLTARGDIGAKDSVIYYFNDNKFVSTDEPKVKEIKITPNGNLSDSFGPGFYDEATRLQFELLKVNKEQIN